VVNFFLYFLASLVSSGFAEASAKWKVPGSFLIAERGDGGVFAVVPFHARHVLAHDLGDGGFDWFAAGINYVDLLACC
jgi:hypothetical protein